MNEPKSRRLEFELGDSTASDKPQPAQHDYSKLYTPEGWCPLCWHKWGRALTKGKCRCVTGP